MRIKINSISGYESGKILEIEDDGGIPLNRFWRNRLKDAKLDNCVEVLKTSAKRKEQTK